jgi:hypothetical protein
VVAEGEQVWLLADHQRRDLTQAASSLSALRQAAQSGGAGARDLARNADRIGELLDLARQLGAQSECSPSMPRSRPRARPTVAAASPRSQSEARRLAERVAKRRIG